MSPLYSIVDARVAATYGWKPADLARAYLRGGARLLQVRAKELGSAAYLELCEEIVEAADRFGAQVIVNDRADVAVLAGAAGIHVGQDDLSPADVRKVVGPASLVGLSTHAADQVARALLEPIDYLAVGPVFATGTKETGYEAVGLDLVRHAAAGAGHRPVVAIGGITIDTAPSVMAAGAAAVAVIGDLLATGDPEARAREFVRRLDAVTSPAGPWPDAPRSTSGRRS
jgi:thiamine-phosphate pyrophosphorylase